MRPRLEATNLAFKDIEDQPESSHVLIVAEHFGVRCAMAVDYALWRDGVISFFRVVPGKLSSENELVAKLPTHLTWVMIRRDSLDTLTTSAYMDKVALDNAAVEAKNKAMRESGAVMGDEKKAPVDTVLPNEEEPGKTPSDMPFYGSGGNYL